MSEDLNEDREVEKDTSGHVKKVLSPSDDAPEATLDDPQPARAPGGVDATMNESDVGAVQRQGDGEMRTADAPLAAQTDEVSVPDALQEGEEPDEASSDGASDPESSKSD